MIRKIAQYLPAVVTSFSIISAVFFIYYGTLSMNHSIKKAEIALPTPTIIAIVISKYHLSTIMAIFCLFTIGLIEWKVRKRENKLVIEVYILSLFLFLTAVIFIAMALPFACLCDGWKQ